MSYNKAMLRVCAFASTDETRINLAYCVHDEASKALVATDGHRAIWDRSLYSETAKAFKAKTYLKTGDMVAPDWEGFKYPNINSFRPNENDYSDPLEFEIPEWIGKLKTKRAAKFYFDIDGAISITPLPKDFSCAIDMMLLTPIAGETVRMRFKMTRDKDGNLDKVDSLAPVWIIVDETCDIVVMPLRA